MRNLICLFPYAYSCLSLFSQTNSRTDEQFINALDESLPVQWEIVAVINDNIPSWSLRGLSCKKIILAGEMKTGMSFYDDYNGKGNLLLTHYSSREAIEVWITDSGFDDGWSIGDIIKNRFRKSPIKRPVKWYDANYQVFAKEGLYVFDSYYKENRTAPQGTKSVSKIKFKRSWSEWRNDLKSIFKNLE